MKINSSNIAAWTVRGLDCIDLSIYINDESDIEDAMIQIQSDFMYDHLPSDAMFIFSHPAFRQDVFRCMDEDDFYEYVVSRI